MSKESPKNENDTTLTSVSSSLALWFLKKALESGKSIEIPSLNIKVESKNVSKKD